MIIHLQVVNTSDSTLLHVTVICWETVVSAQSYEHSRMIIRVSVSKWCMHRDVQGRGRQYFWEQ